MLYCMLMTGQLYEGHKISFVLIVLPSWNKVFIIIIVVVVTISWEKCLP